jgi:hypothetical protein
MAVFCYNSLFQDQGQPKDDDLKSLPTVVSYPITYILTTHALFPEKLPTFYGDYLTMSNIADVTGSKPFAVFLQSISGVNAINPSVAFYDIHGGKREVLFFYFVPHTTRDVTGGKPINVCSQSSQV